VSNGSDRIDRYRIVRVLGRGEMGEVYEAEDETTARRVALKRMHPHLAKDRMFRERFMREVEAAGAIRSPFVAAIERASFDHGHPWIAFKLLAGRSLDAMRAEVLGMDDVHRLVRNVLQGLGAAHEAGVIHRDLKPANLFCAERPSGRRFIILDFGVAKVRRAPEESLVPLTALDMTLGSYAFMPPEQIRGAATVDARADLYAFGVVLFMVLTGQHPYRASSTRELIGLKSKGEAPTMSARTGYKGSAKLDSFVQTLMRRKPDERFETAHAALKAWNEASFGPADLPVRDAGVGAAVGGETTEVLEP
jgi:serine/threonine-protein kinase